MTPTPDISRWTRFVLLASAALTVGFMLYASRPWENGAAALLFLPLFGLWALAPYYGLHQLSREAAGSRAAGLLVFAAAVLAGASAAWLQFTAFVTRPDPQSGLLYVFLPVYQWIFVAVLNGIVAWMARRSAAAGGSTT